jgi:hypothetical protein
MIKLLGMAAVTAVAAMALVGASSAMAESTQLCTNETGTCVEPTTVHSVTVGHALLLSSIVNVECDALVSATVPKGLVTNGPVVLNPATLSYSNCLNGASVTVIKQGTISILTEGGEAKELATQTASGFRVLVEAVGLHCVYSAEGLKGHALGPLKTGSNKDHVTYSEAEVHKVEGFFCPSVSKLDALFQDLTAIWARN